MFFNPFGRQMFPGGRDHPALGHGPFRAVYKCSSTAFLTDRERDNVENGGKILLPQAALEHLVEQGGIMLFKVTNRKENRFTHCGVLEFIPNEDRRCYLPLWMMQHLLLSEDEDVSVESVQLQTATFARFQPQTKDFLDISNPKAVLETALRHFSCLTKGDIIAIRYLNRNYELCVLELKPADAVKIIECDMEVDFAPPVDYVEPKYTPSSSQTIAGTPKMTHPMAMTPGTDPQLSIPSSYKSPSTFLPFHGAGNRLNGKLKSKDTDQQQQQQQSNALAQQARGIPNYEYEYGTLQFLRTPLRQMNEETTGNNEKNNATTTFQPFTGEGQILKKPKNQGGK